MLRVILLVLYGRTKRTEILALVSPRLVFEGYEPSMTRLISGIRGDLFVDIGANIGQYTVPLALRFRRVLSIEPSPVNLPMLRRNTYRLNNIKILSCAVADYDGEADLHVGADSNFSIAYQLGPEHFRVRVCTLDKLLSRESEVDFVKVDAEGAEWAILKGAENSMTKIKRWLIELHDIKRKTELDRLLESFAYQTRWIHDAAVDQFHVLATRS